MARARNIPENEWETQNYIESEAIYNILEQDIVPLFYSRGRDGLPREWIGRVKNSMRTLAPYFNTYRMVQEYTELYYVPNYQISQHMMESKLKSGLAYAAWRENLEHVWPGVQIRSVEIPQQQVKVGTEIEISALIDLGQLTPEDVRVQLYFGDLNTRGDLQDGEAIDMSPDDKKGRGSIALQRGLLIIPVGSGDCRCVCCPITHICTPHSCPA